MFQTKGPSLRFSKLLQDVVVIVAHGDIPRLVALMLGASRLLAMAKDMGSLHLIAICEVFLWLINHFIVLQLQRPFQEHLFPHQVQILTPGGCETIIFGIKALFDLHLDWVASRC